MRLLSYCCIYLGILLGILFRFSFTQLLWSPLTNPHSTHCYLLCSHSSSSLRFTASVHMPPQLKLLTSLRPPTVLHLLRAERSTWPTSQCTNNLPYPTYILYQNVSVTFASSSIHVWGSCNVLDIIVFHASCTIVTIIVPIITMSSGWESLECCSWEMTSLYLSRRTHILSW